MSTPLNWFQQGGDIFLGTQGRFNNKVIKYLSFVDSSFRQVLTYQGGKSKERKLENEAVFEELKNILLPAALKVFGEENNEAAKQVSGVFT